MRPETSSTLGGKVVSASARTGTRIKLPVLLRSVSRFVCLLVLVLLPRRPQPCQRLRLFLSSDDWGLLAWLGVWTVTTNRFCQRCRASRRRFYFLATLSLVW